MYFVAKDITDRKLADTQVDEAASLKQATLDSVADGVYVADSQGLISFINPAGVRFLRYESADELNWSMKMSFSTSGHGLLNSSTEHLLIQKLQPTLFASSGNCPSGKYLL
jgi:PAS domain-containing protein